MRVKGRCTEQEAINILRIYGPGSCAELARAGKVDRDSFYKALFRLRRRRLVAGGGGTARYELTDKGRRKFAEVHHRPLLKEGGASCE